MDSKNKIFKEIEQEAITYVAHCLVIAGCFGGVIWFLNLIDVFTVHDLIMNTTMPIGIVVLASPAILIRTCKLQNWWVKYYTSMCFVLGIAILHSGMTYQVVLAWACPILLSCHYYSSRVTKVTFITTIFLLLLATYVGLYWGSWDANIMNSTEELMGFAARNAFIQQARDGGKNYLSIAFNFYYIPMVLILSAIYVISTTLSSRTHGLLDKQQALFLEKERIGAELSVATKIQNDILPNTFPAPRYRKDFALHATMNPSKEVGGDFYDFFLVDEDHLALVIADVSGKGVPAAMFMMLTKMMIKNLTTVDKTPAQILIEVNNQLCETNQNNMFVTVWFGIYQISTGHIIATNAGHEYPIIQRHSKLFELWNDRHDFVIGGMEDMQYRNYELQLDQGDTLFLYTDGVVEATNQDDQLYGTQRLLRQLNGTKGCALEVMLQAVKDDVDQFAGNVPQFDDITMLAIQHKKPLP